MCANGLVAGSLSLEAAIQNSRTRTIERHAQAHLAAHDDDAMAVDDEAPRGLNPLASGELVLGRGPQDRAIKWPHLALIDASVEGSAVISMAITPDGSHIATGMDDSVIRIWNYKTGSLFSKLAGHEDTPWSLSYSPDGRRLVSGSADNVAIIWDVFNEVQPELLQLRGHDADVWSVMYSPDGRYIASGATDSSVRVWDADTGEQMHVFNTSSTSIMQVHWTPDSRRVVSCANMEGKCWDVQSGQETTTFTGHEGAIWCMNISAEGDRLITGSEDHTARIWDLGSGQELVTIHEHTGAIWSVAFSSNGQEVVTGGYDNRVIVSDSFTGETRHVWASEDQDVIIDTVAFSRGGDLVASGAADGNVKLYDSRSGAFIAQYQAHTDKVKSVQFSQDDEDVLSSSDDGSVRVWNLVDTLRIAA